MFYDLLKKWKDFRVQKENSCSQTIFFDFGSSFPVPCRGCGAIFWGSCVANIGFFVGGE